ncbi:uncharacterized protein K460DRAFT_408149 [Cucurbitaria berberidis CBS 394.84]|uniref:Uncharacterized protein n=1 Tax=Cucurbitaria berberidis CBS 394.84 TaxID=1168544 RepID=A0A9P4GE61_9PLEO|nr:uncharacterized protein K460DRAFT_408149 [Cucurbitaria berberidis CBS 394.84]KAF1843824.1 hypothetical protein K460DRAFT_408149 [Cucurbitaria berberidis CBS 394.84]
MLAHSIIQAVSSTTTPSWLIRTRSFDSLAPPPSPACSTLAVAASQGLYSLFRVAQLVLLLLKRRHTLLLPRMPYLDQQSQSHDQPFPVTRTSSVSALVSPPTDPPDALPRLIQYDDETDEIFDNDEETAVQLSCLHLDLTDDELFSMKKTNSQILKLVSKIIPELSPSDSSISRLRTDIKTQLLSAPPPPLAVYQ